MMGYAMKRMLLATVAGLLLGLTSLAQAADPVLLNVSYDPTRELYVQINAAFQAYWKSQTGQTVHINMSHGGSGEQARAVINGLDADVVTLGVASDIDALHDHGNLVPADWEGRLPDDSTPYTSTVVFLVRQGNPKHIVDWNDLVRPGVGVITPNPKTSAGGRWNFLAAYAYALRHGTPAQAQTFMKTLYQHVPLLSSGARGSTLAFTRQHEGDVMLAWENEAYLAIQEAGSGQYQMIVPSISMLAQPPVAVVEANAKRHHTEALAEAYLRFLYTPQAQEIIARNDYRPTDAGVAVRYAGQFPQVIRVNISAFGGWRQAQAQLFDDGGLFDKLYQ
jgi:sulfate transport system substrate-binding protein